MNVRINLSGLKDEKLKVTLQEKMERLVAESEARYQGVRNTVENKL